VAHAELSEDSREVPFDRPIGKEKRGRDLAIRLAIGDEGRDALLGGGEGAGRRGTTADSAKLALSTLRPERRTDLCENGKGVRQRRARLPASLCTTLSNA
jgi:hypothetical protein